MAIHNSYHLEHFFNWAYRYVGTSTNPSAFCKISSAIIFHLCIWLQNVNICCCSCLFLYKLRVSIVLLSGFPHTNVSFIFDIYYDNISTFTIYARMSNLPRNGGHTLFKYDVTIFKVIFYTLPSCHWIWMFKSGRKWVILTDCAYELKNSWNFY